MKVNEIIKGFKLIKIKEIADIASTMYEFKHLKSGASLIYLENEDTNKCFTVGFRTLPENSTGICHIIEHSLLCGSEKYPLKEPFVNLLKGSMATFLNAFTASDWTMYPVASQNDRDFDNLVGVYLDAVFAPLSMKDNRPFLQEGWHLELNNIDDVPSYKGVVYNEMKGAMSSVDEQLSQATLEKLYEGSCYEHNSGGDPDVIPTLTYEYYQDFYRRHYHPSNSLIYLYGKMNLEEKLEYIDKAYLSNYERSEKEIIIDLPNKVINTSYEKEYEISDTEDEKDNTYMSLAFGLDEYKNAEELTAFDILNEALMSTNDSPLKKMLLDAKLGQDVVTYLLDDCIVPSYHFYLQKTNKENKELFYNTLISSCQKLIDEGIDKNLLLATINNKEFKNKEMDSGGMPKGLFFAFSLMQSYNYKVPYENYLEYSKYYDLYRQELNNNYFENLLKKYIINSQHYVEVVLNPSKSLGNIRSKEMENKMLSLKEHMTLEEKEEALRVTKDLMEYQSKKDTKEELDTLPKLNLADISSDVNTLPTVEDTVNDVKVIKHEFNTNKIAYFKLYFDLKNIEYEELSYVPILIELLGKLDTKGYKASDLQSYIKTYLGNFTFDSFNSSMKQDECTNKLVVNVSSLFSNIDKMNVVLDEVINKTIFDSEKVKTIILQIQNMTRNKIIGNGMAIAMDYARASLSKEGAVNVKMSGYNLYQFVSNLVTSNDMNKVTDKLYDLCKKIFVKENLTCSLSGEKEVIDELMKNVNNLPIVNDKYDAKLDVTLAPKENMAVVIPSQVSYNGKAFNIKDFGMDNSGKLFILGHILRYDYLWPEIRVKGGAYGCNFLSNKNGDITLGSYRDPNVTNTYEVYNNIYQYLENLDINDDEFSTYLIGAIGSYDRPLSNNLQITVSDYFYQLGYNDNLRRKYKKEMIETTLNDVKGYSELFKQLKEKGSFYTIGNETAINAYNKFSKVNKL